MRVWNWIRTSFVAAALAGILMPTACFAQTETTDQTPTPASRDTGMVPLDIALSADNVLAGTVVDQSGTPAANAAVWLFRDQLLIAAGKTAEDGSYKIADVRGGTYQLVAGDNISLLRCWAPNTAPPNARESLLMQVNSTARGQIHPASCVLANPWVIAGIAAAAIVIPVALSQNRDDRPLGSG